MNVTSISLSYFFLGLCLILLSFFAYFKVLTSNASLPNGNRDKIIGNMKDPKTWLKRNNRMAYTCLFWAIISLGLFIYLKFFVMPTLINIFYLAVYALIIVISILVAGMKKSEKSV